MKKIIVLILIAMMFGCAPKPVVRDVNMSNIQLGQSFWEIPMTGGITVDTARVTVEIDHFGTLQQTRFIGEQGDLLLSLWFKDEKLVTIDARNGIVIGTPLAELQP